MRAVIQRVSHACVAVDGNTVGSCGKGYLILLCVMENDTEDEMRFLASKIAKLRIFEDENGKINRSVTDVGGEILLVSQFTLAANCSHGNRPDFLSAAKPEKATELFDKFKAELSTFVPHIETGVFGAHMDVTLENDGPFTVILDTDEIMKKVKK
ncbi:MAG: D-tyrosyl-tRNA(Tyr) deacylase [Clostridia bacterium]|nr:D-tyrosyl-tRNA(Tyr) deacylase [Clostridia bacterium]